MKKIPSVFQRNYDGDRLIRDEVVPGCEWVLAGDGIATRKWDGTAVLIQAGEIFKRYDAKHGKTPPEGFVPAQDADPTTGHWPGWVPVGIGTKADAPLWEALARCFSAPPDGTYELIGPKVNGNKEGWDYHELLPHGLMFWADCPRDFAGLREWLSDRTIEGLVFRHPDGRMAKVKRRDFGLPWPAQCK